VCCVLLVRRDDPISTLQLLQRGDKTSWMLTLLHSKEL
jgi:hypothetical protein